MPVLFLCIFTGHGIEGLLDLLVTYVPTPTVSTEHIKALTNNNEQVEKMCVVDCNSFLLLYLRLLVDPFVGKISIMKVVTGKLTSGIGNFE